MYTDGNRGAKTRVRQTEVWERLAVMHRSPDELRVFVSSTSKDLQEYRAVARNVILELHWVPEMMEFWDAQSLPTVQSCCEAVEKCDLVLLIVAWQQGWVPAVEQGGNARDSITALELAFARSRNIPVLVLLANDSWPGKLWENKEQEKRTWVDSFRAGLNQVARFFDYEEPSTQGNQGFPAFRSVVKQTLLSHKEKLLARGESAQPALDFFPRARDGLLRGTVVPVVGCGVHGAGPLSSHELMKALFESESRGPEPLSRERLSLATAAEYWERFDGSREIFLDHFRQILERQMAKAQDYPLLDLLASLDLNLIVSATHDLLLEKRLAERKFTVVSHVLRSGDVEKNGRLLLLRPDSKPEFPKANEFIIEKGERILYKPQGSPFVDPDLDADTVVVTESDHATFLRRLQSPETGVPASLLRQFKRSPLLFLGYTMDDWQYRLMMVIFRDLPSSPLAVRVADDKIEAMAWNGLKANLILMDPNQFARSAMAAASGAR